MNFAFSRLLIAALLLAVVSGDPSPPIWPQQYHARGVFAIPYFNIEQPTEIWYDSLGSGKQRLDYYYGMDSYLVRNDLNMTYEAVPRIDQFVCFDAPGPGDLVPLLPDLRKWSYNGSVYVSGRKLDVWVTSVRNLNRTNRYAFITDAETGDPVQSIMEGEDYVFISHPDIYIFFFEFYEANFTQDVFEPYPICTNSSNTLPSNLGVEMRMRSKLGLLEQLHPDRRPLRDEFDLFQVRHAKHYRTDEERVQRRRQFDHHQQLIASHNSRSDVSYQLGMNRFGDFTETELEAVLYPHPKRRSTLPLDNSLADDVIARQQQQHAASPLPSYVNWVEKHAVNPPKDQGICGSCWTFGTIASIEGVYAVKHGVLLSLSEQQLVDCAWTSWDDPDSANLGCDGGFAAPAIQWGINNGGLALESSYPYLMEDHWCNPGDKSSGVKLLGYVNVTSGSELALQTAVANIGPIAIAMDATYPDFVFYQSGVFTSTICKNDLDDLDHEVVAVGYGTTEQGVDYWLVKNSWSDMWGDGGYVYIARNDNNMCGVATQATYPVVQ